MTYATAMSRIAGGFLCAMLAFGAQIPRSVAQPADSPTPSSIFGLWSESAECRLEDAMIVMSARFMIVHESNRHERTFITYAATPDGIAVTPVRTISEGVGRVWLSSEIEWSSILMQRRDNTLRIVRRVDRAGLARDVPAADQDVYFLCQ